MALVNGVMAVVPTPLTVEEDCDQEGVEKITEFLACQDVGMFSLGSAGEGMNLSFDVRVETAKRMAQVNAGRTPLAVGGGTFSVKDCLKFIDEVADEKIDAIHVIPYDGKISGNAVEHLYTEIADRSPLPIWLYQNTTRTSGIPLDVVARLRDHPNITGCKLAGFDLRLNQNFLALATDSFEIVGSADSQFFTYYCLGATGSTTSSAACFPELFKELHAVLRDGNLHAARALNQKVMAFLKLIPKGAYKDNGESSAELKYLASKRGLLQPIVAKPFRPLNSDEQKQADKVFELYEGYLETGMLDLPG